MQSASPAGAKSKAPKGNSLTRWPARSPLFVGRDGELITTGEQCSLESSGPSNVPAPTRSQSPARSSGLRHTYAAELASSDVSVYTLMKLLGHESMTTSQRYVAATGTETRSAAARNPLYATTAQGSDLCATPDIATARAMAGRYSHCKGASGSRQFVT